MSATTLLRALAVVFVLFAIGHTLGTYAPAITNDQREADVFAAMQSMRFAIGGFERTHWDFYRGHALTGGVLLVVLAGLAWSTASVARSHPRAAIAPAAWLTAGCAALVVLGVRFFFIVPITMSAVAFLLAAAATVQLLRAGR